ncbi:gp53-like domain-containing protein [Enterobacter asburiae]
MATNNFKPFATAANANVVSQADWEARPALLSGFTSGKAASAEVNKAIRQASFIAAALAQYTANKSGQNVLDDADLNGFIAKMTTAFGKDFQALDATLTALAGLATGANKLPYFTGTDTAAQTDLTQIGRDVIGQTTLANLLSYLGLGTLQSSFTDKTGKIALNGGWGLGIKADQATGTMAALDVSRFDYFAPADNIGPYPGRWAGGISFANSGKTGWQICGASLGSIPDFSVRIKASDTAFSDWYKLYHTGFKPTSSDISGLGTAATKNVGTGSGQIPDMSSFTSGTGWASLPGGTIIQWGFAVSGQIGDPQLNNFPIPFTNYSTVQLVASYDNAGSSAVYSFAAQPISNTQFKLLNPTSSPAVIYARWIAIGR